jgi:hypothetical protein
MRKIEMAISRKPSNKSTVSEAEINAIIEKGGSVAQDNKFTGKKNLQLRLEADLINQIDAIRDKKTIPPSRHTWILEAIHEKLQKELQC